MKRAGQLIYKIADPDNLRLAYWKARKGKEDRVEVQSFLSNLDENLSILRTQLLSGEVEVGNYHYFKIYDPKERMICAAAFPERVLHHALMNICHPIFENFQIYDSYATRKDKGTYAALSKAQRFQYQNEWFLKMDIRKYFDSIDHKILLSLLQKRFKDQYVLHIFHQIITSYETTTGKGLPIGNLTSQYFANYYLAFLDRYIKQELLHRAYVRYMDDMVFWHSEKSYLLDLKKKIGAFLNVDLQLDLKIAAINKNTQGLNFIGYRIFKDYTLLSKRSKIRFKKKFKRYADFLQHGKWSEEEYQDHILPLLSFATYAKTYRLRQRLLQNIGE